MRPGQAPVRLSPPRAAHTFSPLCAARASSASGTPRTIFAAFEDDDVQCAPTSARTTKPCDELERGLGSVVPLSQAEAEKNFYFRDGDKGHMFEYGGKDNVHEWHGRNEEDVLIERVRHGLKPVASIVLKNYSAKKQECIWGACEGLHRKIVKNPWGVEELLITATPDASLFDLLGARGVAGKDLGFRGGKLVEVQKLKLRDYVDRSFDLSGPNPVTCLESALLYGYPLDMARESVFHRV